MKKVYLVFNGAYSDRHVCGVFDTLENAESYTDQFRYKKVLDIVPYELNRELDRVPPGMSIYLCKLHLVTGDVVEIEVLEPDEYGLLDYDYTEDWSIGPPELVFYHYMYARDEKHAIKITSEHMNRWKAEHPNWFKQLEAELQDKVRFSFDCHKRDYQQAVLQSDTPSIDYHSKHMDEVMKQVGELKAMGFNMEPVLNKYD